MVNDRTNNRENPGEMKRWWVSFLSLRIADPLGLLRKTTDSFLGSGLRHAPGS